MCDATATLGGHMCHGAAAIAGPRNPRRSCGGLPGLPSRRDPRCGGSERRLDGSRTVIRRAEILGGMRENPAVAPAWGRPDLDAASREFWIGLLATACSDRA